MNRDSLTCVETCVDDVYPPRSAGRDADDNGDGTNVLHTHIHPYTHIHTTHHTPTLSVEGRSGGVPA